MLAHMKSNFILSVLGAKPPQSMTAQAESFACPLSESEVCSIGQYSVASSRNVIADRFENAFAAGVFDFGTHHGKRTACMHDTRSDG